MEAENRRLIDKAVRSILRRQLDGRRVQYLRTGPAEVSATVKAYFALKLAGIAAGRSAHGAARERILALGGMQAANSYVKINLSLFDLYPARVLPVSSAGNGAAARQFHLPDVLVDARDRGSAFDCACA